MEYNFSPSSPIGFFLFSLIGPLQISAEPFSDEDMKDYKASMIMYVYKHSTNAGYAGMLLELFPW